MDIQLYRNFIAIVEQGNLTAASKVLHIAQPALSNQLKLLEADYGAKLMVRGSRRMELTDAGRILYDKARSIHALEESAKQEIHDCADGVSGTLRIGLTFSYSASLFDGLLLSFHEKFPDVKFQLFEKETYEILELVKGGMVEIGLARGPFKISPELEYLYEARERFAAVCSKNAPWLAGEGPIELSALKDLPICITRRFETLFSETCLNHGFSPHLLCVGSLLMNSLSWARAGLGIAIVPRSLFDPLRDEGMHGRMILEPSMVTSRAMVTCKDRRLSAVAQQFHDAYRQQILSAQEDA